MMLTVFFHGLTADVRQEKIAKWERELRNNIQPKLDQLKNTLPAV